MLPQHNIQDQTTLPSLAASRHARMRNQREDQRDLKRRRLTCPYIRSQKTHTWAQGALIYSNTIMSDSGSVVLVHVQLPTIRPGMPGYSDLSTWVWVPCLEFSVDRVNELKFSSKPLKWIRYCIGAVTGTQGDLSQRQDVLDVVNYDQLLSSESVTVFCATIGTTSACHVWPPRPKSRVVPHWATILSGQVILSLFIILSSPFGRSPTCELIRVPRTCPKLRVVCAPLLCSI